MIHIHIFAEAMESENLTIGTTIDAGMAVLGTTGYGIPILITYSVADALLKVTTDNGCSHYIDKASENLIGGSSIYSW